MGQLLILTNSYDATTDLLLQHLGIADAFRLNFDQLHQYRLRFGSLGFCIEDPIGRRIDGEGLAKAYWRKPFNAERSEDADEYVAAESKYVFREIVNLIWMDQKFTLVEPYAEQRSGKLVQLRLASQYFFVPPYELLLNEEADTSKDAIVKSLSNTLVDHKALYTTRINPHHLDQTFPWFVQGYVPATFDITAVYVRGKIFAFSLHRDFLHHTADWREMIAPEQEWRVHHLPGAMTAAIEAYMRALRLDFGRLDFLLDTEGRYWFCEVNPNGQFAWLDLERNHGVIDAVLREIAPETEHHPISNRHVLASRSQLQAS